MMMENLRIPFPFLYLEKDMPNGIKNNMLKY